MTLRILASQLDMDDQQEEVGVEQLGVSGQQKHGMGMMGEDYREDEDDDDDEDKDEDEDEEEDEDKDEDEDEEEDEEKGEAEDEDEDEDEEKDEDEDEDEDEEEDEEKDEDEDEEDTCFEEEDSIYLEASTHEDIYPVILNSIQRQYVEALREHCINPGSTEDQLIVAYHNLVLSIFTTTPDHQPVGPLHSIIEAFIISTSIDLEESFSPPHLISPNLSKVIYAALFSILAEVLKKSDPYQ
jgi:hypothetical protein